MNKKLVTTENFEQVRGYIGAEAQRKMVAVGDRISSWPIDGGWVTVFHSPCRYEIGMVNRDGVDYFGCFDSMKRVFWLGDIQMDMHGEDVPVRKE